MGVFHTLGKEDNKSKGQPVPFTDEKTGIDSKLEKDLIRYVEDRKRNS